MRARNRQMTRLLGCAALTLASPVLAGVPQVRTSVGSISGETVGQGAVFKGIPFGASTGGAARWRPPQPVKPWKGVRPATAFGPICPQPIRDGKRADAMQSEDCLTVNVASAKLGKDARQPVLVLAHGGAYFVGSGGDGFDSSARIFTARGIVVVSFNYRLGRLGFFAHPGLRVEQPQSPVGNYWLMDQVAALQWVRRNIAAFGGDPNRVTILGCSAGGSSINALMSSPSARGLFAGASAHSGGGLINATRPLVQAEEEGMAFARRAGVEGGGAAAIGRLRALDVPQLLAADPGPPNFGAIVDGRTLVEETAVAFAKGHAARVPFIAGSTSNEASVFGLMGFDAEVLRQRFGIDLGALRKVYDPEGRLDDTELLRQVQTDFIFTAGATGLATLAGRWQPSWAYHFAYLPEAEKAQAGAPHCADMGYTFGTSDKASDPSSLRVAAMNRDYLANFVKTGDPNGAGLPAWPQFKGDHRSLLLVGDTAEAVPDFRARQLRYWYQLWARRTGQPLD